MPNVTIVYLIKIYYIVAATYFLYFPVECFARKSASFRLSTLSVVTLKATNSPLSLVSRCNYLPPKVGKTQRPI